MVTGESSGFQELKRSKVYETTWHADSIQKSALLLLGCVFLLSFNPNIEVWIMTSCLQITLVFFISFNYQKSHHSGNEILPPPPVLQISTLVFRRLSDTYPDLLADNWQNWDVEPDCHPQNRPLFHPAVLFPKLPSDLCVSILCPVPQSGLRFLHLQSERD